MAVNLTQGAIVTMCFTSEDLHPVLQVIDLKLVQSQQNSGTERYRVVLSDGLHYQQGMLATQKNELVHSGRLQKGSIVKLSQFICNVVQNRKIIIIVDLDVIMDKCDLIGKPDPAPKEDPAQSAVSHAGNIQSAAGQLGSNAGNSQYLNSGSHTGGGVNVRPNVALPSMDRPTVNPPASIVYSNGSGSARYGASNAPPPYPKPEPGVSLNRPASVNGSYGEQNTSFRNPQYETSRPVQNSYVRPPQPVNQQPSPMYNRGPTGRNDAPPRIIPISALNPYQNMWTIKARVTAKGELRTYTNSRGQGKVFSFDLLDSNRGEIRATCFNTVAEQFYNVIEVGKVYLVSRGSLKPAQKNFNHLPNDQEITLDITSVIQPCVDDNSILQQIYNFRPIGDIENMQNNSIVDVIAVVTSISPTASIIRKNGTETQKRSLQLKDMSGRSVELTVWGSFCNTEGQKLQNICDSGEFPILVVKSARVNDFNGKSIGTIATSQLLVEPDFPEAFTLRGWFDQEGRNVPSQSISRESSSFGKSEVQKTISQIKDENLGTSDKPDWISICANVVFFKYDNFYYTACPNMIGDRKCNKKVTDNGDETWHCERCDTSFEACDYRYLLQMQIQDHTGMTWVTAFQEGGEDIMGMPAKDLFAVKFKEKDEEKFKEIISKVVFTKYMFKLKVKEETFNDEARVKSTVVKAEKIVNFASESKSLLDLIDKLKSEKAEGTTINSAINTTGLGSLPTGQATPPVYNPINSNTNTGRDYGAPANQVSQYGNQHSSSFASSGAPGSYMSCSNCGGSDHSSAQCLHLRNPPEQTAGGAYVNTMSVGSGGASDNCYKCQQPGHWASNCPSMSAANRVSGGASGNCYKCNQPGHWASNCPNMSAAPQSHGRC